MRFFVKKATAWLDESIHVDQNPNARYYNRFSCFKVSSWSLSNYFGRTSMANAIAKK